MSTEGGNVCISFDGIDERRGLRGEVRKKACSRADIKHNIAGTNHPLDRATKCSAAALVAQHDVVPVRRDDAVVWVVHVIWQVHASAKVSAVRARSDWYELNRCAMSVAAFVLPAFRGRAVIESHYLI